MMEGQDIISFFAYSQVIKYQCKWGTNNKMRLNNQISLSHQPKAFVFDDLGPPFVVWLAPRLCWYMMSWE